MNLDIYLLSKLISKQKVKALGLFKDQKIDSETKYLYLYTNIIEDKIKNDSDAKRELNYSESSKAFLKFKERYTKKVIDYILLSDVHVQSNEYVNEEHYKLLKLFAVARIIHYLQQRTNSVKIFIHIFLQAKKLELIDLQMFSATELRQHYAFIEPDKKLYQFYDKELDRINYAQQKNMKLSKFYDKISHDNIMYKEENMKSYREDVLKKSMVFLEGIEAKDSFLYKSKVFEISSFAYSVNNRLEESINISKRSVSLIENSKNIPVYKLIIAYKDIMSTYLKLNDFTNAQIYLNMTLKRFTKQSFMYFRLKSIEYTIYANQKDYNSLFLTTIKMLSSKKLKEFKGLVQEWKLREAFANILFETGRIDEDLLKTSNYKKFKLSKFLNEVDLISRDKRGTNISILIVELMHFLIHKQYEKVANKLDALNQYTFRYLRNDHTLRSNCFIKMLLKIPEAEFHPLRTIRYVKKYEQKLLENPFEVSMKEVDVEIIPYEHLWEIILEILEINLSNKK